MSTDQINEYCVSAEVVTHSSFKGEQLITIEIQLHRFVLPEFNTHRVLSRNFQSSRAVTIDALMDQVYNQPAMPVYWGINQSGMVAENELNEFDKYKAIEVWDAAAKSAVGFARELQDIGVHKQIVNRLLEPFMWTKGIATATKDSWDAFLELRLHPDAQPEIQALAMCIDAAIKDSVPMELNIGDYHLPYVTPELVKEIGIENAIKVSCSCAAQISYRKRDAGVDKANRVYDMLNLPVRGIYPEDPPHYSPTEHVAKLDFDGVNMSGNFNSNVFMQYRKYLEAGIENEFYEKTD